MITNVGKSIITKYLLGQSPAYASHIAIGCGTKPLTAISFSVTNKALSAGTVTLTTTSNNFSVGDYVTISGVGSNFDGVFQTISGTNSTTVVYTISNTTTTVTSTAVSPNGLATKNYSTKTSLDFEMFKAPITSRGYVTEYDSNNNPVSKIVLTAQLPTEERYEITEFGIYPSNVNPTAGGYDSKTVFGFLSTEQWIQNSTGNAITTISTKLDQAVTGTINPGSYTIFQVGSDNTAFNNETRLNRQERLRFYNNGIFITGNTSTLSTPSGTGPTYDMTTSGTPDYIKLLSLSTPFNNYSSTDELRFAFSVINRVYTDSDPTLAKILVKFKTSGSDYASFWINQSIVSGNRYYVVAKKLQDIYKTAGFSWNLVSTVEIYASVEVSGTPSANYYVGLDAMRIENTTATNPLYGLVGYTPVVNIVNSNARPIIKNSNTANFVEFRFVADVI